MQIECQQKNPKVKGTKVYARYEQYKKATTTQEALSLGAKPEDLAYDLRNGFIKKIK